MFILLQLLVVRLFFTFTVSRLKATGGTICSSSYNLQLYPGDPIIQSLSFVYNSYPYSNRPLAFYLLASSSSSVSGGCYNSNTPATISKDPKSNTYLASCSPNSANNQVVILNLATNKFSLSAVQSSITAVNFGPTNFNWQYSLYINNMGTINFDTVYTLQAYVSYGLNGVEQSCIVKSVSVSEQKVKCPPPNNVNLPTSAILARFEFHANNGAQAEGYSQIIISQAPIS